MRRDRRIAIERYAVVVVNVEVRLGDGFAGTDPYAIDYLDLCRRIPSKQLKSQR